MKKVIFQLLNYLISKGANINAKDEGGDYIIHYASKNGLLSIVQYLIEKQNIDINIKGNNERTPLHCACEEGHIPIAEYLISKNANVKTKVEFEETPFHCQILSFQKSLSFVSYENVSVLFLVN